MEGDIMVERARLASGRSLVAAALAAVLACGEGRPVVTATDADVVSVHLSAGTPVQGATVTVYAVHDSTGEVNSTAGEKGVVGIGGPTDAAGDADVRLTVHYVGPLQVVANGANLTYRNPNTAAVAADEVRVDGGFSFTSYYPNFVPGETGAIPVNLLTTLADAAAKAYAAGLHPRHPGAKGIAAALGDRDQLFVRHIVDDATAWNPAALRRTVPADLTTAGQTLNDAAFAALFDVALSTLAEEAGSHVGYQLTAVKLVQLLQQDVAADGTFDGKGAGGAQLTIDGASPESSVKLSSQYLRIPLAKALDGWIQSGSGNISGITQSDLVNRRVFASISGDASDLFGDPPDGLYDPADRTSPALEVVKAAPRYTNQPAVGVTVKATDGTGVRRVFCQWGSATPVEAARGSDGNWSCQFAGLAMGASSVLSAWGEDTATPTNSGRDAVAPYRLLFPVVLDNTLPSALQSPYPANFRSEKGMTLATDGAGRALVPAAHLYAGDAQPRAVSTDVPIYKSTARLGWSATPTAALLEGDNPDNIPVIQYMAPYDPQTEAPVVSMSASLKLSPGGNVGPVELWPSARTEAAVTYFDLPLSSDLVPALASLGGETTLPVNLTVTDAAGNTNGVDGGTFRFDLIAPPVAIAVDAAYPAAGDPRSTYPYTVAGLNYGVLYDPAATAFADGAVRLVRLLVTNPYAQAVALAPPAPGSWSGTEAWGEREPEATGAQFARGAQCDALPRLPDPASCGKVASYFRTPTPWAPTVPAGSEEMCLWQYNPAGEWLLTTWARSAGEALLSTVAYDVLSGGDWTAAERTPAGSYVVPPAHDGQPGTLALYVVRPRAGVTREVPIAAVGPWRVETGRYYLPAGEKTCNAGSGRIPGTEWVFSESVMYEDLLWGKDSWSGSVQPQTFGLSGAGLEVGQASTSPVSVDVSGTANH
jgi:hypothetical protein